MFAAVKMLFRSVALQTYVVMREGRPRLTGKGLGL
jgi:hypothetical protein